VGSILDLGFGLIDGPLYVFICQSLGSPRCTEDINRWFSSQLNTTHLVLFDGRVCSSLDAKGKNTTKYNNDICDVFQLEHPPLASNRGTHLHMEKSTQEGGSQPGHFYPQTANQTEPHRTEPKYRFVRFSVAGLVLGFALFGVRLRLRFSTQTKPIN
jgi:hypothetical protein